MNPGSPREITGPGIEEMVKLCSVQGGECHTEDTVTV